MAGFMRLMYNTGREESQVGQSFNQIKCAWLCFSACCLHANAGASFEQHKQENKAPPTKVLTHLLVKCKWPLLNQPV
eukprot:1149920-Pelagomonas_calceolata.AAC.6